MVLEKLFDLSILKFSPSIYLSNCEIFNIYEYTSFRQLSLRMLYNISLKFKSAENFLLVLMSSLLHSYFLFIVCKFHTCICFDQIYSYFLPSASSISNIVKETVHSFSSHPDQNNYKKLY